MGFGFLVPAFLAGLAALAVPILLHLRHRDRDRPMRFPSLMFLQQLPIRTESRQRISDWPLLLLRALALTLLVLAFARPVFKSTVVESTDSRAKAVVILLDRSQSMGYSGVWSRALDSARAVIDRLDGKDRAALVTYDDEAEIVQRLTEDRAAVRGSLSAIHPLKRGTRMAPALRTARQLLLDAPFAAAEVVVISDLQRSGATGIAGVEFPTGVTVRGIGVGAPSWQNSSVRSIEARRVREGDRTLLAVKARVSSHGLASIQPVTATLNVNGRNASTASVSLPTDGETTVTFTPVAAPDGAVVVQVSLPTDSLAADDTLAAIIPRDYPLRVTLVTPGSTSASETLYLEQALSIGRAPEIRVGRTNSLPSTASALAQTDVVVLWDEAPDPSAALTNWISEGGSVVVAAGRRLAANHSTMPAYVGVKFSGLTDRTRDRGGSLRDISAEHPLFAPFREVPEALNTIRFWQYPRSDISTGADILARFDDGLPALIEQRSGSGRALTLMLPLDNQQSDFPLQPAYLPFVRQLVSYASGRDAAPLWRTTGDSWLLPTTIKDPVVETPTKDLVRPTADSSGAAVHLPDAGIYRAYAERASGEPAMALAVNPPASEAELTAMDTTELLLGVRTTESTQGNSASGNVDAPMTVEDMERRQSSWYMLLAAVVLLLLGETLLGTRGRRGMARRTLEATAQGGSALVNAQPNSQQQQQRNTSHAKKSFFKEFR